MSLDDSFCLHLVKQLLLDVNFLSFDAILFLQHHIIRFLGSEMRFEVLSFHLFLELLSLAVIFNLLGQIGEILEVVPSFKLLFVLGNQVLLVLLPSVLLSFELPGVLKILALLLETLMSLRVGVLQILNIVLTFRLSMVIDLEGTLRSHEVGVSLTVVLV